MADDFLDFPEFPDAGGDAGDFEIDFDDATPAAGDEVGDSGTVTADDIIDIDFDDDRSDEARVLGEALGGRRTDDAAIDDFFASIPTATPSPAGGVPEGTEAFTVLSAGDVLAAVSGGDDEDGEFLIDFDDDDEPAAPSAPAEGLPATATSEETAEKAPDGAVMRAPAEAAVTLQRSDWPAWLREMVEKTEASVSHSFLLEFNTKDYAYRRVGVRDLVAHTMNQMTPFHVVAYYNLADGLHFPAWGEDLYRDRLLDLLGRKDKIQALAEDEVAQQILAEEARRTGRSPDDLRREAAEEQGSFPTRPEQVLELLRPLFEQQVAYEGSDGGFPCLMLWVDSAETILPDQPLAQMRLEERQMLLTLREMSESKAADAMGNVLVMTAGSAQDVHEMLRVASSRTETVTVPLPDRDERLAFIREDIAPMPTAEDGEPLFSSDMDEEVLANLSAGLSKMQIEDIALRAIASRTPITEQLVKDRKGDIIRSEYGDVIEILDPAYTFADIGGLEHVKSYFREEVIEPIRRGDTAMAPQGALLVGPAGTGKTMVAQALAAESRMNCVNLDLSKILNRWVGSSERNFDKALRCIRAMEPIIVIVEEIDEAFPTRGGDSTGVSSRIFKRFLEFMSDPTKRGKVLVIATSNYPSRMDAALRRPGRFDKKIPFFVPDEMGRLRIMKALAERMGYRIQIMDLPVADEVAEADFLDDLKVRVEVADNEARSAAADPSVVVSTKSRRLIMLRAVLRKTEGMTGAEIETIIQKAASAVYRRGKPAGTDGITIEDLRSACEVIVPSTSAIGEMTDEALRECNDLEFVPASMRSRVRAIKDEGTAMLSGDMAGSILSS